MTSDHIRVEQMKIRPEDQTTEEWRTDYEGENDQVDKFPVGEKPRLEVVSKEECSLQNDLPLVEPGIYTATYLRDELHKGMFKEGICKLGIQFETYGEGISTFVKLEAWFPVSETKNGFSVSKRSNYARQFFTVFPDLAGKRMDRLSPKRLKGIELEVKVVTVTKDSKRNPIPKSLQYSKINRILGRNE